MHKYLCVPVEYQGEFLWCVFETTTEQVVKSFYFEDEATDYINFLVKGGAFAGWTPSFFLEEIKRKININEEFANIV